MENAFELILAILLVFTLSALGTKSVIALMKQKNIMQNINQRSMHHVPTPVGGGWSVILSSLTIWLLVFGVLDEKHAVLLISILGLAVMSWLDDMRGLPQASRFGMQILAVGGCLYFIPADTNILHSDLPIALDRLITAFCWLWFINLFNFMDGLDGLASSGTICIALGIVLIGLTVGIAEPYVALSLMLASAMGGFLLWNWHPAKIFLGDVGSIPVGFLLGWLLIQLSIKGALLAAVILPLYFVFDASLTLLRRVLKGEKIWEAHRQHLYQKAALSGLTHAQVVRRILPFNIMLIISAYLSIEHPIIASILALLAILLTILALFSLRSFQLFKEKSKAQL